MPRRGPARFPPDVAAALQRPEGKVSVRYTVPASYARRRAMDAIVMETPYEDVLIALVLDTKDTLRFVRTGSRSEGARVALVPVDGLVQQGAHWDIELEWDPRRLAVRVREQHADPATAWREGCWPR